MDRITRIVLCVCLGFAALTTLGACTTAPTTQARKDALAAHSDGALIAMKAADPTLGAMLDAAAGYAVFPKVGKGGAWLGAAYGKGEVFTKGQRDGYCDLLQITLGFQGGGQGYDQLIVFTSPDALDSFKQGKTGFVANASAVALTAGVAGTTDYARAASIFVFDPAGFMYEAALGVQAYTYVPN